MEQDRAPDVLVYQHELERRTSGKLETVVNLISATTTRRGLRVRAVLNKRWCETRVKISDEQMKDLNIRPHSQNPEWNYSIFPRGN